MSGSVCFCRCSIFEVGFWVSYVGAPWPGNAMKDKLSNRDATRVLILERWPEKDWTWPLTPLRRLSFTREHWIGNVAHEKPRTFDLSLNRLHMPTQRPRRQLLGSFPPSLAVCVRVRRGAAGEAGSCETRS